MHNSIEIDLNALRFNYQQLKAHRAGAGECFAVIKQDAYGHGLSACAHALAAAGADGFAVSAVEEGVRLREEGIGLPIMVMGEIVNAQTVGVCADLGLELALGDAQTVQMFAGRYLPRVWVKINTGMNRYGIHPDDVGAVVDALSSHSDTPLGLMTHLACADDMSDSSAEAQISLFKSVCAPYDWPASVLNSAGYLRWPQLPGSDRARCGIALYGSEPIPGIVDLRPVMTARSQVLAVQHKLVGDRVGYQYRDHIGHQGPLAVIAVGYGNGYPFPGQCGAPVLINGERFPLRGRTSMNMIVADIRGARSTIAPGDEVVLWGQGLSIDEVARANSLISYQLMCAVSGQCARTWRN